MIVPFRVPPNDFARRLRVNAAFDVLLQEAGQRRRVDRDLGAHLPRRVLERLGAWLDEWVEVYGSTNNKPSEAVAKRTIARLRDAVGVD